MNNRGFERATLLMLPLLLAGALVISACAHGKLGRLMPNMGNMSVAEHYFGKPSASVNLPDGTVRHEWTVDRNVLVPAHYETQRMFLYNDSDGFPVFEDVEFFIRDRVEHQTCRISIHADKQGWILRSDWEGNSCESLLRVPTTY